MSILLYEEHGNKGEAAVLEDDQLVEFVRMDGAAHVKAESIYLAKVGRAMQNLDAVFVTLSGAQEGFLPLREWQTGTKVNLETDIIGRYVESLMQNKPSSLTIEKLAELGY